MDGTRGPLVLVNFGTSESRTALFTNEKKRTDIMGRYTFSFKTAKGVQLVLSAKDTTAEKEAIKKRKESRPTKKT